MSGAVELILKVIQDKEARAILFKDPDRILRDYKLTEKEVESLKKLDSATLDKAIAEMGEEVEKNASFAVGLMLVV